MSHIQIRISEEEKAQVKSVLDKMGLTYSAAIKQFFNELIEKGEWPNNNCEQKVEYIYQDSEAPIRLTKRVVGNTSQNASSWNPFTVHKIG